jgi:hypothetical protein
MKNAQHYIELLLNVHFRGKHKTVTLKFIYGVTLQQQQQQKQMLVPMLHPMTLSYSPRFVADDKPSTALDGQPFFVRQFSNRVVAEGDKSIPHSLRIDVRNLCIKTWGVWDDL